MPVVMKDPDIARHQRADVLVPNGLGAGLALLEILRHQRDVAPLRAIPERLAEDGISEQMLGAEEFARKINTNGFFGHDDGGNGRRQSAADGRP